MRRACIGNECKLPADSAGRGRNELIVTALFLRVSLGSWLSSSFSIHGSHTQEQEKGREGTKLIQEEKTKQLEYKKAFM